MATTTTPFISAVNTLLLPTSTFSSDSTPTLSAVISSITTPAISPIPTTLSTRTTSSRSYSWTYSYRISRSSYSYRPTQTAQSSCTKCNASGLSSGATAGIIIAAVMGLVLLGGILIGCCANSDKHRRANGGSGGAYAFGVWSGGDGGGDGGCGGGDGGGGGGGGGD